MAKHKAHIQNYQYRVTLRVTIPFWYAIFRGGVETVRSTQRVGTQYA